MISLIRNQAARRRGKDAESQAAAYLQSKGLQLMGRNYQCPRGEIDLIMRDAEHLVFVEVRHRSTASHGSPVETVTSSKRRKLIFAARHYIAKKGISDNQCIRFDVVGIQPGTAVDWVQNAFWD